MLFVCSRADLYEVECSNYTHLLFCFGIRLIRVKVDDLNPGAALTIGRTIRVWSGDGKAAVLEGHEGPVQCLAVLPDGALLSGSNDKSIRRWVGGTCQQIITGHGDTVRQGWSQLRMSFVRCLIA